MGVSIGISPNPHTVMLWPRLPVFQARDELSMPDIPSDLTADLKLDEDSARALYEALADFFGHGANNTKQLRKDYDHERGRVDTFIKHLLGGTS
jgi:hypothetical protein